MKVGASQRGAGAEAVYDRALALPTAERRKIYEHFNRHETVGTVAADAIGAAGSQRR